MNHLTTHKHRLSAIAFLPPRSLGEGGSEGGRIQYRVSSAQKNLIMQNKANLLNAQMNVSSILTKYYENVSLRRRWQNKANSKPIKANQTQFQTTPACRGVASGEAGRPKRTGKGRELTVICKSQFVLD